MRYFLILIFCLICSPVYGGAGLAMSSGSNNRIDFGSASSLDNLSAATYVAWVFVSTDVAADRPIIKKGLFSQGVYALNGEATNKVGAFINRTTTDYFITASGSDLTTGEWNFVVWTYDVNGADGDQKIYVGTGTSNATEISYTLQQVGAGSAVSNAAADLVAGNNNGATPGQGWPGVISLVAVWNRQLTENEILDQQWRPHPTNGCVLFSYIGHNGTGTQIDLSGQGNDGTISGTPTENFNGPPIQIGAGS